MNIESVLDRLEALPLMGPPLVEIVDELTRLKLRVREDTPPEIAGRVLILEARVRSIEPTSKTASFLSGAELWARGRGLEDASCRLRLMWCRAVALLDINALPTEVLFNTLEQARTLGSLEPLWRMTLAATQHPDAQMLLKDALDLLPSPQCDFERLSAWMELAAVRHDGGDVEGAITFLQKALIVADAHGAKDHIATLASMLAHLFLAQGKAGRARPLLRRAMVTADELEDDLGFVTDAILLSAMLVADEQWDEAEGTATRMSVAAARRGNWLAVADAHLTTATCMMQRGDVHAAIDHLVRVSFRMQDYATRAAVNVIKGRLVEIRQTVDGVDFDVHFDTAVKREMAELGN